MNQRRIFLRQLSEELAKPFIEDRAVYPQVMRHFSTKLAIESIVGLQLTPSEAPAVQNQPRDSTGRKKTTGSCHVRKTRKSCATCEKPVCDEHCLSIVKCIDCAQ